MPSISEGHDEMYIQNRVIKEHLYLGGFLSEFVASGAFQFASLFHFDMSPEITPRGGIYLVFAEVHNGVRSIHK
jgi:hypothetical protein